MTVRWLTCMTLCLAFATGVHAQRLDPVAPASAPDSLQLTRPGEPGTPLMLRLRFVDARTSAPVTGAGAFVYQTDAEGRYTPSDPGNNREPRIHGWLRSAADGTARVRTVVPGSYPGTRIPRHVHLVVNADGYAERAFEVVFDDDRFVDARVRTGAARPLSAWELCTRATSAPGYTCMLDVELAAR